MKDEIKEILINKLDAIEELNKNSATIMIGELKETIVHITNLQEENERLLKQLENSSLDEANIRADILLEQQDYKTRIDKAIEYIKSSIENSKPDLYNDDLDDLHILLNILQGSDE